MEKIVHVAGVEYLGGHRLRLEFENGQAGEVDLSQERWTGVFAPLEDPAYFKEVELDEELGTIVWPNGADIAPETLHRWVVEGVGPPA
ncbi:MAG TPA: DUF2442 domain-containing protein [Solirubrobacterales bacterium]|nr:DUF2442 domain-containing protein [Solirubrobacterales bacterium]